MATVALKDVMKVFADGTVAVKRAVEQRRTRSGAAGWWLLSDNPGEGVDSRHRGPVAEDDVVAIVLARAWPRPARLRPRGRPGRSSVQP